eukprot:9647152-Alexandrium_andersonii.AAC.1
MPECGTASPDLTGHRVFKTGSGTGGTVLCVRHQFSGSGMPRMQRCNSAALQGEHSTPPSRGTFSKKAPQGA